MRSMFRTPGEVFVTEQVFVTELLVKLALFDLAVIFSLIGND